MATTPFRGGATASSAGGGGEKKPRGRKAGSKGLGPKKLPQRGMGVAQLEELRKREMWWPRAAVDDGASAAGNSVLLNPDHRFQILPPSFHDPLAGSPVHFPVQHQLVGAGPEPAVGANSPNLLSQYLWALHHRTSRFGDSGSPHPRFGDWSGFGDSSSGSVTGPEVPYNPSSDHCNGVFKKKRTEHYWLPEKAPVTGYCNYAPPNEFGSASDQQVMAVHRKILESSILMSRKICHEHQFFPQKINGYNFIDHESPDVAYGTNGEAIDLSLRL